MSNHIKTADLCERCKQASSLMQCYHLKGINAFCGTNFRKKEIAIIYQELGNCVNHQLTLKFIRSGFNMAVLEA